jgi:TonB family protein
MKKSIYIFLFFSIITLTSAQQLKLVAPKPLGGFNALISKIVYDEESIRNHVEGNIVVRIKIDEKGEIASCRIVKSLNPKLDKSVLDAVRSTIFLPGVKDGVKTAMQIDLPLLFKDGNVSKDNSAINLPKN